MSDPKKINALVRAIHKQPELGGCKVMHFENGHSRLVHPGNLPSVHRNLVAVIEVRPVAAAAAPANSNSSKLVPELFGFGLTCTFTAISGLGVVAGAAAEIPTGGMSTPLTVMAWTGVVTGGLQCLNGAYRVSEIVRNPNSNSLDQLDHQEWYAVSTLVVDFIGVGATLVALPYAARNLVAVLQRSGNMIPLAQFQALPAAQRKEAVKKAFEATMRTPEGRDALEKALAEAKINRNGSLKGLDHGFKSVQQGTKAFGVIRAETAKRIQRAYLELITVGAGFAANATDSSLTGSASGSLNYFLHLILPEEKPAGK